MKEIAWDPNIVNGQTTTATIEGRYGIDNITKIVEGKNDEITITVDGTEKTIRLDSGEYTVEDLIKNINNQIGELPIEATNENGYIKLVCKNAGSEYR